MKKSELDILIRTIVKEEIAQSIPIILAEMANALSGTKQVIREDQSRSTIARQAPRPAQRQPVPTKKVYTQNPMLNEILNQTHGGISYDDPTSMVSMMADDNIASPEDTSYEAPAAVENLFTKDYSSFLKKMDTAAQKSRPA